MKKIVIRIDANHAVGLGHAVRVAAILEMLHQDLDVTVVGTGVQVDKFFPGANIIKTDENDEGVFAEVVKRVSPDVVLIDLPTPTASLWATANSGDNIVVVIDDLGGQEIPADLIINGTILDQYHHYPNLQEKCRVLAGPEYALIRPIFGQLSWKLPKEHSVLIVVGGGERATDWAFFVLSESVDRTSWGNVSIVVGNSFPRPEELQQTCKMFGVHFVQGCGGDELARFMSQSSVALITGGMVVYEAIAIGVPSVVFPQVPDLSPEAESFSNMGCIVNLGYEGGMQSELVTASVNDLLEDKTRATEMSLKQSIVVDGLGMARAAKSMNDLMDTLFITQ